MPEIAYAEKMAQKSNCFVLDVSDDDPATTHGCTSVMLNLLNYVPRISPCGEVGIKTEVVGDLNSCSIFVQYTQYTLCHIHYITLRVNTTMSSSIDIQ